MTEKFAAMALAGKISPIKTLDMISKKLIFCCLGLAACKGNTASLDVVILVGSYVSTVGSM
jgi:hypothetical protein